MTRKIENPDNLGPYWREIGYRHIANGVFKREVQSGPAPIVVCAEKFHAIRQENLWRIAAHNRSKGLPYTGGT